MKFRVLWEGSIYLVRPLDEEAAEWLHQTAPADAQWWASALVVEHRYVVQVLDAIVAAGGEVVDV